MNTKVPTPPVLEIDGLTVSYRQGKGWSDVVRDVSLTIRQGQTYGLVGESGSGKTTLALAILNHLAEGGEIRKGTIHLSGRDLQSLGDPEKQDVWRNHIKLVPQNPLSSLNPSLRIGKQLAEAVDGQVSPQDVDDRVLALLAMVDMPDPARVMQSYPHQLSGGMQQRVMIALALSSNPELLVLDEPTTNLDVTTEATILDLFTDLIRQRNTAVLFVSHSLGVITQTCDRVAVLYAGELVEDAAISDLHHLPLHPYTRGLLDSVPRVGQNKQQIKLIPIPGQIPRPDELPNGCIFAPRCPVALDICHAERPPLDHPTDDRNVRCHRWPEIMAGTLAIAAERRSENVQALNDEQRAVVLHGSDIQKRFAVRRSLKEMFQRQPATFVRAVDGVDLQIRQSKTFGLVGESGSGKTTLARCIVGLERRSDGEMTLFDMPLPPDIGDRSVEALRQLQIVFQNPDDALNPHRTVRQALKRPLMRLSGLSAKEADEKAVGLMKAVKLDPNLLDRWPDQLSGGEKQRVAIARAFAVQPDLLILDESVSALDVSVQASILNLLKELQDEQQTSYLFISHDLAVVGYLADEVAVMYLGQVMEVGPSEAIFAPPYHPYTEALLSAIPRLDPAAGQERIRLVGDIPSAVAIPSGCRFHTRCHRYLGDICKDAAPPWQLLENGHRILCHIPAEELRTQQQPLLSPIASAL